MEQKKVIACIQARMSSTRLPGKVLMKLAGKTPIEWISDRLKQTKEIDQTVLVTSAKSENDVLINEAERLGIKSYREEDENDVLGRFLNACRVFNADVAVRVTADCPLVDAELVDLLVSILRKNPYKYDAVTNVTPATFPDGSNLDVLAYKTLQKLDVILPKTDLHRDWMTPFLYNPENGFSILNVPSSRDLSTYRITLDYPEDLQLITTIFEHFKGRYFSLNEIINFLDDHPEIQAIVKNRIDLAHIPNSQMISSAYQEIMRNKNKFD